MDWDLYVRGVVALVVVIALIGMAALLARRFGAAGGLALNRRSRRLGLVEALPLDGKRRLVLVRRDGVEHLLLLGGGADLLVESIASPASEKEDHP